VNRRQAPGYTVLVDGEPIPRQHLAWLEEIRIVDHIELPDVCTVTIKYPAPAVDSHPFEIGKGLEVQLEKREEIQAITLFKGDVVTLEPEFGAGGCRLTVRGFDKAHVLLRSRNVRTWQNQTPSDIVKEIVTAAGLDKPEVDDNSGDPLVFMQQDNETDWDFIWRLARRIGFEAVADRGTFRFRKPSADSTVELKWPSTLRSFSPRVTAVQQVDEVTLLAHNPLTKEVFRSSAKTAEQHVQIGSTRRQVLQGFQKPATIHVATEQVDTQAQADRLAHALLDRLANGYAAAEGTALGNPRIKASTKVRVSGVGSKFSGTYRVATATHVLRPAAPYTTSFSSSPRNTVRGSVGPGTNGSDSDAPLFATQLALGIVTNTNDPEGLGRVRVNYPVLGEKVESAWAQVVWPSAGQERGLMMLPVLGEEVLIGFLGDTTRRPYVLGSLFNRKDTPGGDLLQQGDGSFALRSDKRIYAESQEDFTQKSGRRFEVEGQSVTHKASQQFEVEGQSVTLKASQPFDVQGQSVRIKGSTQVTIEGSATLSLKCGGSEITLSSGGVTISGATITGKGTPAGTLAKGP
jgi:phage protein D